MLAEKSKEKSGVFFAHTNDRCGKEEVSYGKRVAGVLVERPTVFYRIGPSPLDEGKWIDAASAAASRFALTFHNRDVTLTEHGVESAKDKTQTLQLKLEDGGSGSYVIKRANDDATLQLLSFSNIALGQAILARNPEPSTLTLSLKDDGKMSVEWRGLRAKKKADGSLDSIIQPSASAPTTFSFKLAT